MAYDPSKLQLPAGLSDRVQARMRAGTSTKLGVLQRGIEALPAKYDTLKVKSSSNAKLGLTGLGSYVMGDDPSTPQIETAYRKDNRIGDKETAAVKQADNAANARGLQFSSFRDKSVGDALGRMTREAQQVISQYAGDIGKLTGDQSDEETNLYGQMSTLYGEESDWIQQNPLPPTKAELDAAAAAAAPAEEAAAPAHASGETVWHGSVSPNLDRLNEEFGYGAYTVTKTRVNGKPRYTVTMK
jgi:hypothetical protein